MPQRRTPLIDLAGKHPGKTLLVTGGMDGDEYAGMAAALRLAEAFRQRDFSGRLLIIPIANIPGFENASSQNPLDGKYPKNIFPGRAEGTPTERLVHWVSGYAAQADAWYDAHGGATTERLHPFVWMYETRSAVDAVAENIRSHLSASTFLVEKAGFSSKAKRLARMSCAYLMAESGERGTCRNADVARHLDWMRGAMAALGMIDAPKTVLESPRMLHRVSYLFAPFDGIWRAADLPRTIKKGEMIGMCSRPDRVSSRKLLAGKSGTVLWWNDAPRMKRGEVLCAIGY